MVVFSCYAGCYREYNSFAENCELRNLRGGIEKAHVFKPWELSITTLYSEHYSKEV